MTKLTVDQFVEQIRDNNLEYALSAEIITDYINIMSDLS